MDASLFVYEATYKMLPCLFIRQVKVIILYLLNYLLPYFRQGSIGNGCDGNIGGPENHQCVLNPNGKGHFFLEDTLRILLQELHS